MKKPLDQIGTFLQRTQCRTRTGSERFLGFHDGSTQSVGFDMVPNQFVRVQLR